MITHNLILVLSIIQQWIHEQIKGINTRFDIWVEVYEKRKGWGKWEEDEINGRDQ